MCGGGDRSLRECEASSWHPKEDSDRKLFERIALKTSELFFRFPEKNEELLLGISEVDEKKTPRELVCQIFLKILSLFN